MDAERNRVSGRQMVVGSGKALFVESVSGFVHDPEKGGGEIVVFVSGGEANVRRAESGAERVRGGVDAALLKIKAEGLRDFAIQGLLVSNGSGSMKKVSRNR